MPLCALATSTPTSHRTAVTHHPHATACAQYASIAASDARAYRWADADAYSYAYSRTVNAADTSAIGATWRTDRKTSLRSHTAAVPAAVVAADASADKDSDE